MPFVQSIVGFRPIPRYDGVAWTIVNVEEAPAADGPWTQIDTQALPNPDPDPTQPATRNITTTQATLARGWYRLIFEDVDGNTDEAGAIALGGAADELPPSPDAIRDRSDLLAQELPPTTPENERKLRERVTEAIALVQGLTYRHIDPGIPCPPEVTCEDVPEALVPVAFRAVTLMAERMVVTGDAVFAKQLATGRRLRGFTAGPYSESYFAPGEFARRGAAQGRPPMDPDEQLDAALWALATTAAREDFVAAATGLMAPAGVATAFDYRKQGRGVLPLGWRGGPDGF